MDIDNRIAIREAHANGKTYKEIMAQFGYSYPTIWKVVNSRVPSTDLGRLQVRKEMREKGVMAKGRPYRKVIVSTETRSKE